MLLHKAYRCPYERDIMNKSIPRLLFAIALTGCLSLPAMADSIAFSNLGPAGSYDSTNGYSIFGSSVSSPPESVAGGFTASVSGTLSQIDLGLGHLSGSNTALVRVYTDVNSDLGALIFSGQVSNQPQFGSTGLSLTALHPSSGALLAGNNYFLLVEPGAAGTFDAWNLNSTNAFGKMLFNGISAPATLPAFEVRVDASPVPEPATWLTLGTGLLAVLSATRRKI